MEALRDVDFYPGVVSGCSSPVREGIQEDLDRNYGPSVLGPGRGNPVPPFE